MDALLRGTLLSSQSSRRRPPTRPASFERALRDSGPSWRFVTNGGDFTASPDIGPALTSRLPSSGAGALHLSETHGVAVPSPPASRLASRRTARRTGERASSPPAGWGHGSYGSAISDSRPATRDNAFASSASATSVIGSRRLGVVAPLSPSMLQQSSAVVPHHVSSMSSVIHDVIPAPVGLEEFKPKTTVPGAPLTALCTDLPPREQITLVETAKQALFRCTQAALRATHPSHDQIRAQLLETTYPERRPLLETPCVAPAEERRVSVESPFKHVPSDTSPRRRFTSGAVVPPALGDKSATAVGGDPPRCLLPPPPQVTPAVSMRRPATQPKSDGSPRSTRRWLHAASEQLAKRREQRLQVEAAAFEASKPATIAPRSPDITVAVEADPEVDRPSSPLVTFALDGSGRGAGRTRGQARPHSNQTPTANASAPVVGTTTRETLSPEALIEARADRAVQRLSAHPDAIAIATNFNPHQRRFIVALEDIRDEFDFPESEAEALDGLAIGLAVAQLRGSYKSSHKDDQGILATLPAASRRAPPIIMRTPREYVPGAGRGDGSMIHQRVTKDGEPDRPFMDEVDRRRRRRMEQLAARDRASEAIICGPTTEQLLSEAGRAAASAQLAVPGVHARNGQRRRRTRGMSSSSAAVEANPMSLEASLSEFASGMPSDAYEPSDRQSRAAYGSNPASSAEDLALSGSVGSADFASEYSLPLPPRNIEDVIVPVPRLLQPDFVTADLELVSQHCALVLGADEQLAQSALGVSSSSYTP